MYKELLNKDKKISVTGLGYVGLPLALELAKHFSVIGFDINEARIQQMQEQIDPSKELEVTAFEGTDIQFTSNAEDLKSAHFHIISVPTDVDEHKVPDLTLLERASENIGKVLKQGDYVVYESTVYPGCTEEDCLPILEKYSGLQIGQDFKIGYSPERIVPGDKVRTLRTIPKIVSGYDEESLKEVAAVYRQIIEADIHEAPSIKVAEAAKVIENTQRDLNISLMNELAIVFDKMGIDTHEVLAAAGTKWNFLKFHPGLVGGHCIGVDPYYLLHKARKLGIEPEVIAAGRRVNDYMPAFVAKKMVQMLLEQGENPSECKVLVMGITFKENVSDIRNSKVADLVRELMDFSISVDITDPYADGIEVEAEYGLVLKENVNKNYDGVIIAVGHTVYKSYDTAYFQTITTERAVVMDLKKLYDITTLCNFALWRL